MRQSEAPDAPVLENVELYKSSYALVIGNDAYNNGWPPLANAVKDAELIAEVLEEQGFEVELHRNLVSEKLKSVFERFLILKGDDPDARLFIWYAGHGHTEAGEGYLIPIDAPVPSVGGPFKLASAPLRDFGRYMRQAVSKHVYAVFDSCFAGTVFSSQRDMPPAAITLATTRPVRQFLTSGDADQTVSDDGSFRELFIRALRGDERSDLNIDGYLTASELGMFLTDRVTNLTESMQTPRYGKLRDKNFDRGDFVFTLPGVAMPVPTTSATDPGGSRNSDAAEIAFWNSIKDSGSATQFDAYIKTYPQGSFVQLAMVRKQDLAKAEKTQVVAESFRVQYRDEDYLAVRAANVRDRPFRGANRVAQLEKGDAVWVIGVADTRGGKWYRIARDGLELGFVYSPLLEQFTRTETAATEVATQESSRPDAPQPPVVQVPVQEPTIATAATIEEAPVVAGQPATETRREIQPADPQTPRTVGVQTKPDRWAAFEEELDSESEPAPELVATATVVPDAIVSAPASLQEAPVPQEPPSAELRPYLDSAKQGDTESQFLVGHMYQNGINTGVDLEQAYYWYGHAAMNGDVRAQLNLGLMSESGQGTETSLAAAAQWYSQAAAQGNADAQQLLAYFYETGRGVAVDYVEAIRLYTNAAQQGKVVAQHNLGRMYQLGLGVPVNLEQARHWYEQAASQGSEDAKQKLSLLTP